MICIRTERQGRGMEVVEPPVRVEVSDTKEMVTTTLDLRMILAMFLGTFISVVCSLLLSSYLRTQLSVS